MLRIQNLSHHYKGQTSTFEDVSFTVKNSEIACIFGESGCGKTTLLRTIAGFERIESGTITLGDKTFADQKTHLPPEERKVGFVFQDYALFPNLSIEDNILFAVPKKKRPSSEHLFDLLQLNSLRKRYPHQLSGGQQQRTAIARALAFEPDLLMLDEPMAHLDPELKAKLKIQLKKILKQTDVPTVIVSHSFVDTFDLADTVGFMDGATMGQWTDVETIYRQPQTMEIAQAFGICSFLKVTPHTDHSFACVLGQDLATATKLSNQKGDIVACIRPDDLAVSSKPTPIKGLVVDERYRGFYRVLEVQMENHEIVSVACRESYLNKEVFLECRRRQFHTINRSI